MAEVIDSGKGGQFHNKKRLKKLSTFNEEFDLSLFLLIVQKNWKWVLIIFLSALTIVFLYLRYAERIYEETCIMQIGSENTASKVLGVNAVGQSGDELAEATELMRSRLFLEKVFKTLNMQVSYYTEGTFMNHEIYPVSPYVVSADSTALVKLVDTKVYVHMNDLTSGQISYVQNGTKVSISFTVGSWFDTHCGRIKIVVKDYPLIEKMQEQLKKNSYFFTINDYSHLAKYYSSQINISLLNPDAKTIKISCRDYNDMKAGNIVNAIAQEYISYDIEKRSKSAESILNFIDEQLGVVYGRIKLTEETLDTLQHKTNYRPDNQPLENTNISRISNIEDQITGTDLQQKLMAHIQNELNSKKEVDPMELVTLLSESEYAGDLRENLANLRKLVMQKEEALNDVTPSNADIIHVNEQIDAEKKLIFQSITEINTKLDTKKQELDKIYQSMLTQLGVSSSNTNIEYLRLQRLFSVDEKYYDLLLEKKSEYEISKAGFVAQSQVLENALPAWILVSPKKSTSIIIALIGGLSASLIVLLIIYLFYNNLTSVEEIERLTQSSVAIVGIVPLYTKEIPISQLIVNHNPKSALAEAFRTIRTNLQFFSSADERNSKILAVSSTISGEGKTFFSINLAGIIAFSGKKVIILDLDMRRPKIHSALGLENNKGMSTLLIGKYKIEDVVQHTETDDLDVITAGPIPPNPSELVISKPMDVLLESLKEKYDIIIIDNPPVGLVTDGISMMQKADYPIYVMRANYSKREFLHFVDRLYLESHLEKLSIVLNGVDFNRQSYGYGYYGYGHIYGQGGYYE
jgi:capsular exopolysaccharide synthesis family protein